MIAQSVNTAAAGSLPAARASLERALAEGERSFQGLFARLNVRELKLDASERAQLRDWDTLEDMRA